MDLFIHLACDNRVNILAKHLLPPVRIIFAAFSEKFSAKGVYWSPMRLEDGCSLARMIPCLLREFLDDSVNVLCLGNRA